MKLFVWDFHGTLEKGNETAAIEFSNIALERLGFNERFTEDHVDKLYGLKWYQYFEYLLPDLPHDMHLKLQEVSFGLNNTHWHVVQKHISPADHSFEVLEAISKVHDQILVSNTTQESLALFLDVVNMNRFFTQSEQKTTRSQKAFGVDGHRKGVKATKVDVLNEYLKDKSYEGIVVIGDSEGDMKMGQAIGATNYLYVHPGMRHRDVAADYKITDLRKVLVEL